MNKKQNTTVIRDSDYKVWISELKKRFKSSQIKAAVKVNSELIRFYWSLGRDIVRQFTPNLGANWWRIYPVFLGGIRNILLIDATEMRKRLFSSCKSH